MVPVGEDAPEGPEDWSAKQDESLAWPEELGEPQLVEGAEGQVLLCEPVDLEVEHELSLFHLEGHVLEHLMVDQPVRAFSPEQVVVLQSVLGWSQLGVGVVPGLVQPDCELQRGARQLDHADAPLARPQGGSHPGLVVPAEVQFGSLASREIADIYHIVIKSNVLMEGNIYEMYARLGTPDDKWEACMTEDKENAPYTTPVKSRKRGDRAPLAEIGSISPRKMIFSSRKKELVKLR